MTLIGTLAKKAEKDDFSVFMVTQIKTSRN